MKPPKRQVTLSFKDRKMNRSSKNRAWLKMADQLVNQELYDQGIDLAALEIEARTKMAIYGTCEIKLPDMK